MRSAELPSGIAAHEDLEILSLEAMDDVLEGIILGRLDADDKLADRTRTPESHACWPKPVSTNAPLACSEAAK